LMDVMGVMEYVLLSGTLIYLLSIATYMAVKWAKK